MIYLKSVLAGFAALFVFIVVLWVSLTVLFTFVVPRWGKQMASVHISFGPILLLPIIAIVLTIFALGFYWEFYRASGSRTS
jgi:hypothetical protein